MSKKNNKIIHIVCTLLFLLVVSHPMYSAIQSRLTSRVVRILDNKILIGAGWTKGVKLSDQFEILRIIQGQPVKNIGIIMVTQVYDKSSLGIIERLEPGYSVSVSDMVVQYKEVDYEPVPLKSILIPPQITNKLVQPTPDNEGIQVFAKVQSYKPILHVYCIYRFTGDRGWKGMDLLRDKEDMYSEVIPPNEIAAGKLAYFLVVVDNEDVVGLSGSSRTPHLVNISIAEPYFTNKRISETEGGVYKSVFPAVLLPGAVQLNEGNKIKGLSLLCMEVTSLAAGLVNTPNQGIYLSLAGFLYLVNMADGLISY